MKWKTVVNTGAERGFVVTKARVAQSIGRVACWTMDGTDDGLSTSVPSATNGFLVVGLNHTAIAAGSKGLVQVYGIDDDAVVTRGAASDASNATGCVYDIYSLSSCLKFYHVATDVINSASDGAQACFFVGAASVASGGASSLSTTTTKMFLRCL